MKTMAGDLQYNKVNIGNGIWAVAKPLEYFTMARFEQAWHVLIGRALAVYFSETEIELYNKKMKNRF